MLKQLLGSALALVLMATAVNADEPALFTPGGSRVPGVVNFCQNSLGQAVACPAVVGPIQVPTGGTPIIGVGTGTVGAVSATLALAAGQTTYLCTLDISALGGTATVGPITVTGLLGGTFTYQFPSSASGNTLSRTFNPCLPASGTAVAIVATTTADASASAVDVNLSGFQIANSTATFPSGATPQTAIATGTVGVVSASLAGAVSKTTYICSMDIAAIGGTATIAPVTISGLAGGTMTFQLASTATGNSFGRTFSPCLAASATNTAIVTATTADGTATAVDVQTSGFQF